MAAQDIVGRVVLRTFFQQALAGWEGSPALGSALAMVDPVIIAQLQETLAAPPTPLA
jgi:hypothetical protein